MSSKPSNGAWLVTSTTFSDDLATDYIKETYEKNRGRNAKIQDVLNKNVALFDLQATEIKRA